MFCGASARRGSALTLRRDAGEEQFVMGSSPKPPAGCRRPRSLFIYSLILVEAGDSPSPTLLVVTDLLFWDGAAIFFRVPDGTRGKNKQTGQGEGSEIIRFSCSVFAKRVSVLRRDSVIYIFTILYT